MFKLLQVPFRIEHASNGGRIRESGNDFVPAEIGVSRQTRRASEQLCETRRRGSRVLTREEKKSDQRNSGLRGIRGE